jgi:GNAT superfamily N-acetyltransferase
VANAEIVVVGPGELALVRDLYNEIFRPARDLEFFRRRLLHRHNSLMLIANIDGRPVGFSTGYERMPEVYFAWLLGVLPDFRRAGVGAQLFEAQEAWARDHAYQMIRHDCFNQHRAMLHLLIRLNYNVMGLQWDVERHDSFIVFEKILEEIA